MQKVGNVEIYTEKDEVIDMLTPLPKMEYYGNLTILEFIQRNTDQSDFGTVLNVGGIIYVIYKFDRALTGEDNAGLVLTRSGQNFANEQQAVWEYLRSQGASFSDKIFKSITEGLSAQYVMTRLSGKRKGS